VWDRWKEAAMPKTSWIRPVVSIQYQLVTDGRTDGHTTTKRNNKHPVCRTQLIRLCNRSVFSFLRTLTTWHCPHSPAACRCCRASALQHRRSRSPAARVHSSSGFAVVGPCWDRQTDGHRTVTYRSCFAYYAGSADNKLLH